MTHLEAPINMKIKYVKETEDLKGNLLNTNDDVHIKQEPLQRFFTATPQLDTQLENTCIKEEAEELNDNLLNSDQDGHIKQDPLQIFFMTTPQVHTELENKCTKKEMEELENIPLNSHKDVHIKHEHVQIFSMTTPQLETQLENKCIKEETEELKDNTLNSNKDVHSKQDSIKEEHITGELNLYVDHEMTEEMAIGPVVLQQTGAAQASCVRSTTNKKKRPRRAMSVTEKIMVTNVYKHTYKNWPKTEYWSLTDCAKKTAEMLGISPVTVRRIVKENKMGKEFQAPKKTGPKAVPAPPPIMSSPVVTTQHISLPANVITPPPPTTVSSPVVTAPQHKPLPANVIRSDSGLWVFNRQFVFDVWYKYNNQRLTYIEQTHKVFQEIKRLVQMEDKNSLKQLQKRVFYICTKLNAMWKKHSCKKAFLAKQGRWLAILETISLGGSQPAEVQSMP